ncbi:MAG: AAA family ATPase [Nitrospirae bacterium]|nr:AAA family ATPase [Nitrospirota bacterium]
MFLVELVLQGVRGFRELARLRFKDDFNIVVAGNESGKTTAADSLRRLLFPSNQTALLEALVSRHAPDASRSALVLCTDDGAYFRIIQDFSKRAVNLSRYNATSKDYTLLHKDWDNAVQFMGRVTTGMTEEDFSRIFIFQREHHAARSGTIASAAEPRSAPGTRVPPEGGKSSGDRERLAELRESLRLAEEAADAEYKYQSAKLALEEIEKKTGSLGEIEQKKAEIASTLDSLKGYEKMPQDLPALIEAYERRQVQKQADADELNKQIEGLTMQLAAIPAVNLVTDTLFIAGVTVGVLSILAGVFVLTEELALLFPAGLLLSLILMAGGWYNGSRKNMRRKKIMRDEEDLKQELVGLERRFQQDGASVTATMRLAGASTPAELKEKAENYRHFRSLADDIEEQHQRSFEGLTPKTLRQQYEHKQQEIVELEKAAQAVARNNVDTYSIRQDIERLDSNVSNASAGASWDFGAEAQELPDDLADFSATISHGGFLEDLRIASRAGGIEMETLVPAVEAAAQRNLVAVTAGKYVRLEAGQEGDPIVHANDDSVVAYPELSHGTRSLIYFCLRAGLVEALAGKRRFPFILDDPLADLDPARQKAACQVLRTLGAKTQVILFTSNPALRTAGDAAVELK